MKKDATSYKVGSSAGDPKAEYENLFFTYSDLNSGIDGLQGRYQKNRK